MGGTITIGNRSFQTPVLVPSVSSFETQLLPADALRLQLALREPISLVSAYDAAKDPKNLVPISIEFRKSGVILLDSGGYEASRSSQYAQVAREELWTFDDYAEVAKQDNFDFAFSYDYFPEKDESGDAFLERLITELRKHSEVLDIAKLIPVIHLQSADAAQRLSEADILNCFRRVSSEMECRFIAVPERELGVGLPDRARLTRLLATQIRSKGEECGLHILGCGNLLSFSMLSVAGATMCDGLEWCRTLAVANFHLHHFQQKDLFSDPQHYLGNPMAEFLVRDANLDYPAAVAVHNLLNLQAFTQRLHARMGDGDVHKFIGEHYGEVAGAALRAIET